MSTIPDANGVPWTVETFDLHRDIMRLQYRAKSGDRVALSAAVALTETARAMDIATHDRKPRCASCNFIFSGRRRPAGVVAAVKCDDVDGAPLAEPICSICIGGRRDADILDGLIERAEARVAA